MHRKAAMSKRDTLVISSVSFSHSETAKDLFMFIFMLSSRFLRIHGWDENCFVIATNFFLIFMRLKLFENI